MNIDGKETDCLPVDSVSSAVGVLGEVSSEAKPRRIGRPTKSKVLSKTKKKTGLPRGRPKGDAAILNEYKARMLASPKSRKVLDSILNAALDDGHKHQAVAWKIVADRLLPVSSFEAIAGGSQKPSITINISGVGDNVSVLHDNDKDIDGDYEVVEEA